MNEDCRVVVFWGQHFNEALAAIFISELRSVGIRVTVVGLNVRNASGARGLTLLPDCMLDEALLNVSTVTTVILPCDERGFRLARNDPRFSMFCKQVLDNWGLFVIGRFDITQMLNLDGLPQLSQRIESYGDHPDPIHYARIVAARLAQ